jgi:hypothetical protein
MCLGMLILHSNELQATKLRKLPMCFFCSTDIFGQNMRMKIRIQGLQYAVARSSSTSHTKPNVSLQQTASLLPIPEIVGSTVGAGVGYAEIFSDYRQSLYDNWGVVT